MKTRKVQTKTNAKSKSEEWCWVLRRLRGLTSDTVEQKTFLGTVDTEQIGQDEDQKGADQDQCQVVRRVVLGVETKRGLTTDSVEWETLLGLVDTSSTTSSFIALQRETVDGMVGVRLLDDSSCVCQCHQSELVRSSQ